MFTPLLPSVTVGTVEARSVVEPIRRIVEKKNVNVNFCEAECFKIDAKNKKVYCRSTKNEKEEFVVDYDYLVVAMGARVNTFNTPGVEENCLYLKEVEDAQKIRRRVIDCFEKASLPNVSDDERKRMLHEKSFFDGTYKVPWVVATLGKVIKLNPPQVGPLQFNKRNSRVIATLKLVHTVG